jgi:hypothetical protein
VPYPVITFQDGKGGDGVIKKNIHARNENLVLINSLL